MFELQDLSIIIPYTNKLVSLDIAVFVFCGILISILLYSLALFFYLKNKFYFFSFIYILSILLFIITITGVGDKYLWLEIEFFKKLSFSLSPSIFIICSILFLNKKINTKNNSKNMIPIFYYFMAFPIFVILLALYNYNYSIYLAPFLLITYFFIILIGCIYSLIFKLKRLNFYLIPKLLSMIFSCFYIYHLFYYSKISIISGFIMLFSFLIEISIITFLGNKKFEKILLDKAKIKKDSVLLE